MPSFTITSADNGSNVPSAGFKPGNNFVLNIGGGSTISAELHKKGADGVYRKILSSDNLGDITGYYDYMVIAGPGDEFTIAVTTATGTWTGSWTVLKSNHFF